MRKTFCAAMILALSVAPALAAPAKSCLQIARISNWNAPNSHSMIVSTTFNRAKYKLEFMGSCSGVNFRETVAFKAFGGSGLSCLTPGDSVLYRNDFGSIGRCPIQSITLYTPAMEQADKAARAARRAAQ